jgi:hypothetical protein
MPALNVLAIPTALVVIGGAGRLGGQRTVEGGDQVSERVKLGLVLFEMQWLWLERKRAIGLDEDKSIDDIGELVQANLEQLELVVENKRIKTRGNSPSRTCQPKRHCSCIAPHARIEPRRGPRDVRIVAQAAALRIAWCKNRPFSP